jgi:murein DD-endopeptidase MepM/ murein hydrolase activator NlpD
MFDPKRFGKSENAQRLLRWFPKREVMLRSDGAIRYIPLSARRQIAFLALLSLFIGWTVFTTGMYLGHSGILSAKDSEIARLEDQLRLAQSAVEETKRSVAGLTGDLDHRQAQLKLLTDDNAILARELAGTRTTLEATERDLAGMATLRETLIGQLKQIRTDVAYAMGGSLPAEIENAPLPDRVVALGKDLRQLISHRDQIAAERKQMAEKTGRLEVALDTTRSSQVHLLQRFGDLALGNAGEIEKAIAMTGLDVNNLVASHREETGKGGPFIPAGKDELGNPEIRASLAALNLRLDRWDSLNALLKVLPMVSPLEDFSLNSHFGARNDPINELTGLHEGVDLGGPMRAPVKPSAMGRVIFAGWKGRYGRLIEVDHGFGVMTRYAHLDKIMVSVGQKVGTETVLGLLGSSGRSTGPHLHYEVLVNGRPRDPMRFIKAGRYVLKD